MREARASAKIAERIRALRHRTTVSQQKLADYAGVSKKTVERIESGTENPSLFVLIQLATAFGMTAAELIADFAPDDLPEGKRPHPVAGVGWTDGEGARSAAG